MRKRNNQIHFYLYNRELEELRSSAAYYNLTVTQYIKAMCGLIQVDNIADSIAEKQEELDRWIADHEKEDVELDNYYENLIDDLAKN